MLWDIDEQKNHYINANMNIIIDKEIISWINTFSEGFPRTV